MVNKNLSKIYFLVLTALFTALIIVGALIRISIIPPVPFTLQTMFVYLGAMFLGPFWGTLSALLYMVLGLIGVPVFTSGGGLSSIYSPTFGYIIGFVLSSIAVGFISKGNNPKFIRFFIAGLVGILIVHLIGFSYLYYILKVVKGSDKSFSVLFKAIVLSFIPIDIVKATIAALLAKTLRPSLNKKLL